jgi:citrate synthase
MPDTTASGANLTGTGLEGVSLGRTEIALVDGQNGRLVYRGHDAERLAEEHTFEEVAYLLWHGSLPSEAELAELHQRVVEGMAVPAAVHETMRALLPAGLSMDVLRSGLSSWATLRHRDEGGDSDDAIWALAATPALVADIARIRSGEPIVEARPELSLVENLMLKMSGHIPAAPKARALDAYFTLAAEHGMNASTFTARVIVSTLSDVGSGLVGAVGALKGRLHGGAPSHVSHMIDEIGSPENAEPWLRAKLDAGERLMGFGHRVYRTYDPRARALGKVAATLAGTDERLALARHVEETALRLLHEYKPHRPLYTNVEYYAAAVLGNVDLAPDLYTATFAAARTAGWTAHMLEQLAHNRLIRPSVDYVGPLPAS